MTKAELQAENDKLRGIVKRIYLDRFPDTYFICGESGDKDSDGLPAHILVCPAYGCDWFAAYARVK
jgi:hypothetical protein